MTDKTLSLNTTTRTDAATPLAPNIVAGLLSGLVTLCYSIGYGSMIFSGNLSHFVNVGMPITLVSCGIIALVVALKSSLPFSIGGPDSNAVALLVGLAAGVAADATATGLSQNGVLVTVLAALAVSTLVTGAALYLVGVSRRSSVIQFLPYPVVGGFLGGTGYLLLSGAMRMLTGHSLGLPAIATLAELPWLAWVPAVVVCATLLAAQGRVKPYALAPLGLGAGIVVFFVGMSAIGQAPEQLREAGLLFAREPLSALQLPLMLPRQQIDWAAIVAHLPECLAVAAVSALTILLNSSGASLATGHDADFNQEMRAAGLANLLAGLTGGIVGYQSMSRTMLNTRAGATARLSGVVAGLGCFAVIALFPGLIAWFPKPVLVGLQLYLAWGLLREWLIASYRKLGLADYLLVLLIVAVIIVEGVVAGIVLGIAAACALFVFNYARISAISREFDGRTYHSNVERSIGDTERLLAHADAVVGTCLQGFLFFGTANLMLRRVSERLAASSGGSPRFIVLDFRKVSGLDVSTSATFLRLKQRAKASGDTLVFTGLPPRAHDMLARAGVLTDNIHVFGDLDSGLEWVEDLLLMRAGTAREHSTFRSLAAIMPHLSGKALARLSAYMEPCQLKQGQLLFSQGDAADAVYIIERGRVTVSLPLEDGKSMRLRSYGSGTIVGEMALYTQQPRSADVRADEPTAAWRLTYSALNELEIEDADTARQFHRFVVMVLASRLTVANEAARAAY
ncbi:SulP family sulfate permease [Trinickia symbiotica]|uniref:STAS domain-containing protein n=1 Tax=Trinickia symbiotica TaxID=863227 RepID=A0A2N7WS66_9BURK|nr:SulP family inorganic anion transporter [Trinickia symbiotica]PMS32247.1 STAS domain-containing protein [Trinickia symbiotica]PPK45192.1 SulP family sulfate permease [Trinickia symbiotica]